MKLCIDCEHYRNRSNMAFCESPKNEWSVIDGRPKSLFAALQRSTRYSCGPDAAWFEPKQAIPSKRSIAAAFARFFDYPKGRA